MSGERDVSRHARARRRSLHRAGVGRAPPPPPKRERERELALLGDLCIHVYIYTRGGIEVRERKSIASGRASLSVVRARARRRVCLPRVGAMLSHSSEN